MFKEIKKRFLKKVRVRNIIGFVIMLTSSLVVMCLIGYIKPSEASFEALKAYNKMLRATSFGESLLYSDNTTGRIVWNEAPFMESLLNMFELTKDMQYLKIFIKHADHVLQARDDQAGRLDYARRLRKGWQVGSYYTLGIPVTIPDDKGRPSLEVQAIHVNGNNYTIVEILREDNEHFTIVVRNDFRCNEPSEVRFENLTLRSVEKVVNAGLSPQSWVYVRVVGDAPPRQGHYPLRETYRVVIHELHTPIIGIPFLKCANLVFRSPELSLYQSKANEYVKAFEESFKDYAGSWREDEEGGYFVFEPSARFWASGLTVPYNGLSANGRFLLWLWRSTGNTDYLLKTIALARKVREGITFLPDGTMTMPYWVKGSLPYRGWKSDGGELLNGVYKEIKSDRRTEDLSHFSLTLRFMFEAWQMGVIFKEDDLKAVARTFTERLWKPVHNKTEELCVADWRKGFYLAKDLDGNERAYDYAVASFALLSRWEPTILIRGLEVYKARYKDASCLNVDYLYGEVMLGWSILGLLEKETKI